MAAGKNKLLRWCRLIYGGFDLSGDSRTISDIGGAHEVVDVSGWSESVANSLVGRRMDAGIRGYQALMNDATAGAWTRLLASQGGSSRLSFMFGSLAAPVIGDPAYLIGSAQISNKVSPDGGAMLISADFDPDTSQLVSDFNPFGKVLFNSALTITATGTAINNGAASSKGAHANLHITVSSGGTWTFIIQASTTGAFAGEETTLMTFTINGSAVNSEQQTATGAIPQYIRFNATRTSGTCTAVVTFARN